MRLLVETLRIVNNNLPFRLGEYEESLLLSELSIKDEMKVAFNAKSVAHSIIELYASTKREVAKMIQCNRMEDSSSFALVVDFFTSKAQNTKFLGLRVYMVDNDFDFRSVLSGTRRFDCDYGERNGGIRGPFKRWIIDILHDFGLRIEDVFGSTSDGGTDIKGMMKSVSNLSWEWCIPHMRNACTKWLLVLLVINRGQKIYR